MKRKIILVCIMILICAASIVGVQNLNKGTVSKKSNTTAAQKDSQKTLKSSNDTAQSESSTSEKNDASSNSQSSTNDTKAATSDSDKSKGQAAVTNKGGQQNTKEQTSGAANNNSVNDNSKHTEDKKPGQPAPEKTYYTYNFKVVNDDNKSVILNVQDKFSDGQNSSAGVLTESTLGKNSIHYRTSGSENYGLYFRMIADLSERAKGTPNSGWIFYVNGQKSNTGSSNYTIKNGDSITWVYFSDALSSPQSYKN